MLNPLDQNLNSIAGITNPTEQARFGQVPPGLEGSSMSAANEALGVKLASTGRSHVMSLNSALLNVQNDSVRRLLENF